MYYWLEQLHPNKKVSKFKQVHETPESEDLKVEVPLDNKPTQETVNELNKSS